MTEADAAYQQGYDRGFQRGLEQARNPLASKANWKFWEEGDRFFHAADHTWWKCDDQQRLVEADPPPHLAQKVQDDTMCWIIELAGSLNTKSCRDMAEYFKATAELKEKA